MVINTEVHSAELVYAGQEIEITETAASFCNDRQKVQISLTKVMEQNKQFGIGMNDEMSAVTFGLYAGEELTAKDGKVMWPDETPSVKLGVTTSDDFTETEIKVLRLVCEGLEYSEIAERLNYTKDNVKYHIRNILQKTGYANKTQLAIAVTGKRFIIPKLFNELDGSDENPIVL